MLPSDAALRPENILATRSVPPAGVRVGASLTLHFRPAAPGRYPVLYRLQYIESPKCPSAGQAVGVVGPLGVIVVR